MTDSAIIAASYAAERNYSHNPNDVIDTSDAVGAWGTAKESTSELSDLSGNGNIADIYGAMPTEGFIQGRRFTAANENYLNCGNDSSIQLLDNFSGSILINPSIVSGQFYGKSEIGNKKSWHLGFSGSNIELGFKLDINIYWLYKGNTNISTNVAYKIAFNYPGDGTTPSLFINGKEEILTKIIELGDALNGIFDSGEPLNIGRNHAFVGLYQYYSGLYNHALLLNSQTNITTEVINFNNLACLPFWSVNYTDYPDNVTEYTDNLPYSSSIISSGTFKVDDDKLQCVSAGTMTYSASYEFDGSEYIKVEIGGVEYAGTGTITQGNTTVSVAQGSNKITIEMGTGDTIDGDGIDIQFREEV